MTRLNIRCQKREIQRKKAIYIGLRVMSPLVDVAKAVMAMPKIKDSSTISIYGLEYDSEDDN